VTPPLAVDIDGTLTDDRRRVDPRVFPVLREWDAPVVVATGKAFPYPVALCEFLGIPITVIAENGGVVAIEGDEVVFTGDPEGARAVADAYAAAGHGLGWGEPDFVNRWRETELAVSRDQPFDVLERVAEKEGLAVVDTGFAYHVKAPDVDKGQGLLAVAEALDREPSAFAAVGDSENDAAMFAVADESYAVGNADETAKEAADTVLDERYVDGFLAATEAIRGE
jgi:phosphoglycolate phosphatase (TIGR01487 family)